MVKKGKGGEDEALWQHVTASVRPLRKKPVTPKSAPPKPAKHAAKPAVKAPVIAPAPLRAPRNMPLPVAPVKSFDKGEEQKLRKGPAEIDGRIDLHGMTQAEAYAALHRFIRHAVKNGRRTLLVITGKGRVGGGVLRRQLPMWLEDGDLRGIVLAFTPAKQKDGGDGAFYIKLRKEKKP
jgi:DNA-nicking Smr family endonuclease